MDPQPWRLGARGRWWFDLLLAGGLFSLGVLGHFAAGDPGGMVFTAIQTAPLFWRRRAPALVMTVVAVASLAQTTVVEIPILGQLAYPVAVYGVARWRPRWQGLVALGVGVVGAFVASYVWVSGFVSPTFTAANLVPYVVTVSAVVTTAWALGFAGQQRERHVSALVERAEQAERVAERDVELAAQDERARIAREMHDVVAHGLSVIVVQADGARYAAEKDPGVAVETLETIGATGREALTEMRRMLGLLRSGDSGVRPQPGLADLPHLVEEARATGMALAAELPDSSACSSDTLPVSEGVGLAVYRIVQEALTNVRKHAGPAPAVQLAVRVGAEVEIEVVDDGRGGASSGDGRGLGLVGMRERAAVHGGSVSTGPAPGGGFEVRARIPR